MSKTKRIDDAKELEGMIDRLRGLQRARIERADELDAKELAIFMAHGEKQVFLDLTLPKKDVKKQKSANRKIFLAKKWRVQSAKLRSFKSTDKRIRHFSLKLAELRTGTLPGLLPDQSVAI